MLSLPSIIAPHSICISDFHTNKENRYIFLSYIRKPDINQNSGLRLKLLSQPVVNVHVVPSKYRHSK